MKPAFIIISLSVMLLVSMANAQFDGSENGAYFLDDYNNINHNFEAFGEGLQEGKATNYMFMGMSLDQCGSTVRLLPTAEVLLPPILSGFKNQISSCSRSNARCSASSNWWHTHQVAMQ